MKNRSQLKIIAKIHTDFHEKFGIPRQSRLIPELEAEIVFEPEFRDTSALRGLDGFSHIWLLWDFSEVEGDSWRPTVRPPRLGGNKRLGVFATRSPFRPNPIGLSCVKLEGIEQTTDRGTILKVSGADLLDSTPIYDIKPYIPYADCVPEAEGGFTDGVEFPKLSVEISDSDAAKMPKRKLAALKAVLETDPRPAYQRAQSREYGLDFAGFSVKFKVEDNKLTVISIDKNKTLAE